MQVLGSLLKLPDGGDDLPLPWWHRAPLGLMDGTSVFITLTKTSKRPVGDLLVSVLDAAKWARMLTVDGDEEDQPGVLEKTFGAILPLNIAIAETVTVEPGDKHHVTLVCEPYGTTVVSKDRASATFKKRGLKGLRVRQFLQSPMPQVWGDVGKVEHGWLRGTGWRRAIQSRYPDTFGQVDLSRVVVSADTEKRILRYVFPKKGAFTIRVEHADKPGALKAICEPLRELKLNVLSALLRRGGAKRDTAVLIAVCEPTNLNKSGRIAADLRQRFHDLGFEYRANAKVYEGDLAVNTIYPRHPDEAVTRIPAAIEPYVRRDQEQLRGKVGIFLSRRFVSGERTEQIVKRVQEIITKNGCVVVEAQPEPDPFATSLLEVTAKLWVSRAGIVLVSAPTEDQRALSLNLAHEAGFIQGQAKPLLMLVEEGAGKDVDDWANVKGLVFAQFAKGEGAFNSDRKDSLDKLVSTWLGKHVVPTTLAQVIDIDDDIPWIPGT